MTQRPNLAEVSLDPHVKVGVVHNDYQSGSGYYLFPIRLQIFSFECGSLSLLNCVPYVLKCQRVLHAHVPTCFTCSRANVSCVLTCSRVNVPCVLTCQRVLRAYGLTCLAYLHAHVPTCLACLLAHVPMCFAYPSAHVL